VSEQRVFTAIGPFRQALDGARSAGRRIGLVPTMGALHAGHESLIARATAECDVVAVTIFVNPLQFGDPADLERYPRTLEHDLEACRRLGVAAVFAPAVTELYPRWPDPPSTVVSVRAEAASWEGASRPGHFDGVATVVTKLFAIAGRCRAYFGEKDFQQLVVVRRLVADLDLPVEVVACPTVRDHDGLALSSRNVRLTPEDRRAATVLWRALSAASAAAAGGEDRPEVLAALMASVVATEPRVVLDYGAVVDEETLRTPSRLDGGRLFRLLIAAAGGGVRLIDNAPVVLGRRPAGAPALVGAVS